MQNKMKVQNIILKNKMQMVLNIKVADTKLCWDIRYLKYNKTVSIIKT